MKIFPARHWRDVLHESPSDPIGREYGDSQSSSLHQSQRGTALIVVMALLAIMCVFMICTTQSLFFVKRELKVIEKKQLQRYEKPAVVPGARP